MLKGEGSRCKQVFIGSCNYLSRLNEDRLTNQSVSFFEFVIDMCDSFSGHWSQTGFHQTGTCNEGSVHPEDYHRAAISVLQVNHASTTLKPEAQWHNGSRITAA